jgi:hypothetical protein
MAGSSSLNSIILWDKLIGYNALHWVNGAMGQEKK